MALTANTLASERSRCLDAGWNVYLSKPINRALLIETCRALSSGVRTTEAT